MKSQSSFGSFSVFLGTFRSLKDLLKYVKVASDVYKEDRKHYKISLKGYYMFKGQKTSYTHVLRPLSHDINKIRNEINKTRQRSNQL